MKPILLFVLAALLSACGSTIRLEYTGKHGAVGASFTLPDRKGLSK